MIYVLAYPIFEKGASLSVAAFRSIHEPERAKLVAPHITLVFGLRNEIPAEFIAFCERVTSQLAEIHVDFTTSEVVHDPFEDMYKLFLVTSVGKDQLISLHEQLYDGPQRSELHPDIQYRPHMTVATNSNRSIVERLDATSIGAFPIRAKISTLEVVKLADDKLHALKTIRLQT